MYGLANVGFDDFSADIIEIKEVNGNYEANRIINPFMISLEGVISVAIDSLDRLYTLTNYPRIQLFENSVLVNEIFKETSHSSILHNNEDGEVYLIDSGIDTIFKVNELEIEFVSTIDKEIKEVKSIGNMTWAITNDSKIFEFESDFEGTPTEIIFPFDLNSLNQVSSQDSNIYVLEPQSDGFKLYNYKSGNLELVSRITEDYSNSFRIHAVNDTTFLTSGQFEIEEIANHAFIRGLNINQSFEPIRRNVSISDFELYYQKDTIISGAPSDLWIYGVDFNLVNRGDETTELNSVYTSHLVPQFTLGHFLFEQHIDKPLLVNQEIDIDTSRIIAYYHPSIATASVTGSDYKFNQSFSPIEIGITTSTNESPTSQVTRIFPNPFSSFLNIDTGSKQEVALYSSDGKLMMHTNTEQMKSQNLDWLNNGSYYVKLEKSDELIKVVKVNDER